MTYEPPAEYYVGWMAFILIPLVITILLFIYIVAERVVQVSRERRARQNAEHEESFGLEPAVEWNGRVVY